jgi:YHS domain-containing protein
MITLAIASLILTQGAAVTVACPMTGEASPSTGKAVDYNGVRYTMCCGGCDTPFKKDPAKALKSETLKGKLVGVSLFDPVSGARITEKAAKGGSTDFEGVHYYFASADEKKAFDAEPKKFTKPVEKEALYCVVMGHELKDYATAGGYVDIENVRYYTCCMDCNAALKKDPSLAAKAKSAVKPLAAMDAPVKKS